MADKKKPWLRKFKDYLYEGAKKVVPKKVKKAYRVVKEVIKKGDPDIKMLRPDADKIGMREDAADKALAAHRRKKVVEIKTGKPMASQRVPDHGKRKPKPKPKPKPTSKKDKLITGAAGVAALGAGAGLYKSGEKRGAYKERQEYHDKDLENFRKEQERLKKRRLEKKKKKRGVWV